MIQNPPRYTTLLNRYQSLYSNYFEFFPVRTELAHRNQSGHYRKGPPADPLDLPLEPTHRCQHRGPAHRRRPHSHQRTLRRREEQAAVEGRQEEGAGRPGHRESHLGRAVHLLGTPHLEYPELPAGERNQRPRQVRGFGQLEDASGRGAVHRQHHGGDDQQVIVPQFIFGITTFNV